jgi:5-(carboxyamino)imidazole ribonucleotide synthase
MLAEAAESLSGELIRPLSFRFYDRSGSCPVSATAWPLLTGSLEDESLLAMFAHQLEILTYESENTPASVVMHLMSSGAAVFPGLVSLTTSQDRLLEKEWLNRHQIRTAPYAAVSSTAELQVAIEHIGLPGILKTRRFGYDGKGQAVIRDRGDLSAAWLAVAGAPCVYEGMVEFVREVSQISTRDRDGAVVHHPLTANEHQGGILRHSVAPAPGVRQETMAMARASMERLLESLDHVGTLALELFELADGSLVANEMAPRVHNSGHWTIEGAATSQFENHLRAGLGLPLGCGDLRHGVVSAEMINFIGAMPEDGARRDLEAEGWIIHGYGKRPAPGRKVGHATRVHGR